MSETVLNNHLPKQGSANHFIGGILGLMAAIVSFVPNISIGVLGISAILMLLFLLIGMAVFLYSGARFSPSSYVFRLFVLYSIYCFVMTIAFYFNGATKLSDKYYLVSNYLNFFWVLAVFLLARLNIQVFWGFTRVFITFLSLLIIFAWFVLALMFSDIFFLRSDTISLSLLSATDFRNPNVLARTICMLLPCLYLLYRRKYSMHSGSGFVKAVILMSAMIVFATLSRTNISVLVIFIVALMLYKKSLVNKRILLTSLRYIIGIIIFIIILYVLIPQVKERILSIYDMYEAAKKALEYGSLLPPRIRTWMASLDIISNYPYFGVGVSDIDSFMAQYGGVHYLENNETKAIAVHGGFLKVAVYGGLFSLCFFLVFIRKLYSIANLACRNPECSIAQRDAGFSLRLFMVMLVVMNLAADSFGLPVTWIVIGILLTATIYGDNVSVNKIRNE